MSSRSAHRADADPQSIPASSTRTADGLGALRPLVQLLAERAQQTPDALAFAVYPTGALEAEATLSWHGWYAASRAIADRLLDAGVAHGDRVVILAGNTPLWPIADLAVQMVGAVGVGVYPTSTPAQVEALVRDSGARVGFASGAAHLRTMRAVRRSIGHAMLLIGDVPRLDEALPPESEAPPAIDAADAADVSWRVWLAEGAAHLDVEPGAAASLDARMAAVTLDDLAALIYTSGSTGVPKGACISHRYLAASAASIASVLSLTADDSALSFLPYSHAAERVFGQCTRIRTGMSAALIEDPTDVFAIARVFEPTLFGALPRLFERLFEAAEIARRDGQDPRSAITARIGTRCRIATSGGAALPTQIAVALSSLGLSILGAYGQTEHLCVAMNRTGHVRFDGVGTPMPGTEVRIADDGELLVKRSALTFSGYWHNDAATREAFTDDGQWLRTGDRAALEIDGTLRITGRVKELIALSTGRKIAPLPIEASLVESPYVAHAVCYGEGRKYLTALLSPRRAMVESWARAHDVDTPWPALAQHPQVHALLQDAVSHVNAQLARTDRIQRFAVTATEFTLEGGELTPTLKVLRGVIASRYATTFDALYQ